jgi:exonuclease SbcD
MINEKILMRILHTSDWHLGQSFMGKSREEEHQSFLAWLLEAIEDEKINVLIVAGDIFDTGTPANYALELYYNFLTKLSYSSCKTICREAHTWPPRSVNTWPVDF